MEEQSQPSKNEPEKTSLLDTIKSWQFLAGFLGWYLVNGLYWVLLLGRQTIWQYAGDNFLILAPTFCLNLLALILLSAIKPTRKIGLGILTALAVNLVIASVLGVAENAWCFYPFFANQ